MTPNELEVKQLPPRDFAAALALAESSRMRGDPEVAESTCLDVLAGDPENARALELLLLARTDLLEREPAIGVEKAREVLDRLTDPYRRAYYGGLICEKQAHHLLARRGARAGAVAYDWLRRATDEYETAMRVQPDRVEPLLRYNACVRLIARTPHCVPASEDDPELELE